MNRRLLTVLLASLVVAAGATTTESRVTGGRTAAQDRERLLKLVGLTDAQMRRPPATDPEAPNATNYDESKANQYPKLPDPLLLKEGKRVTTAEKWWSQRRPEIVDDFEREVLGRAPADLPAVKWEVKSVTPENWRGIDVVTKRLVGRIDNSSYPGIAPTIELILFIPVHASGPVPVLIEMAFQADWDRALARPFVEPPAPGTPGYGSTATLRSPADGDSQCLIRSAFKRMTAVA